jgi:predicted O-methyltransferase YrrM
MRPALTVLGDKRTDGRYLPSYAFGGADLGERHRDTVSAVQDISGWLRPEDVLKLYELAYFSPGAILEIGCHYGKSTVAIARALMDRESAVPFFSIDIDAAALRSAARTAAEQGVSDRVVFVYGSVVACFRAIPNLRPSLVFIDGDHSREAVRRDLRALRRRVPDGATLLFHDFLEGRNYDPADREYGVTEAVDESWVASDCEFAGVFGSCGLFVRRRGGPESAAVGHPAAPIVDALLRDSLRMQYLQRLRWPIERRLSVVKRKRH